METTILAVAPYYWGRGKDRAEALRKLRAAGCSKGAKVILFETHPKAFVDRLGNIIVPSENDGGFLKRLGETKL